MNFLTKLLGGSASNIIDSLSNTVDKFTLSKQEKQEFKLELQQKLLEADRLAAENYQKELETRADIIKAEMAQGDLYTKRARPTIVYVGLLFIFIVHVLVPSISYFCEASFDPEKTVQLPEAFWWAWSSVVGIYGVGRTAEKYGTANKITQLMTGSGAHKATANTNKAEG